MADMQRSCGMVYGDGHGTMCGSGEMEVCETVSPSRPCADLPKDACVLYTRCAGLCEDNRAEGIPGLMKKVANACATLPKDACVLYTQCEGLCDETKPPPAL